MSLGAPYRFGFCSPRLCRSHVKSCHVRPIVRNAVKFEVEGARVPKHINYLDPTKWYSSDP